MKSPVTAFKALADETRLRIVALLLTERELCVCDIIDCLKLPQSTVSRHLAYLRRAGIVSDRRCRNWMYYSLSGDNVVVQARLLEFLRENVMEMEFVRADRARLLMLGINTRCD